MNITDETPIYPQGSASPFIIEILVFEPEPLISKNVRVECGEILFSNRLRYLGQKYKRVIVMRVRFSTITPG